MGDAGRALCAPTDCKNSYHLEDYPVQESDCKCLYQFLTCLNDSTWLYWKYYMAFDLWGSFYWCYEICRRNSLPAKLIFRGEKHLFGRHPILSSLWFIYSVRLLVVTVSKKETLPVLTSWAMRPCPKRIATTLKYRRRDTVTLVNAQVSIIILHTVCFLPRITKMKG